MAYIEKDDSKAVAHFPIVVPQTLAEGTEDNLFWAIREDGVLSIDCDGDMPDWDSYYSPWTSWLLNNKSTYQLKDVVFSGNITSIGARSFYGLSTLTSISLPGSIVSINGVAFADCSNLATVTLPAHLEAIGNVAFADCTSLTSLVLPDSVTYIGDRAFDACKKLSSIKLSA